MIITNTTKKTTLSRNASIARTFVQRFLGLIPRTALDPQEALIFYRAPSIHMFFMRFPIDVVFLDENMRVIKICQNLAPWRMAHCFGSMATIEFPAGICRKTSVETGDILAISPR